MNRRRCICLVLLGASMWSALPMYESVLAETQLNGEYQFLVDIRKQDRFFQWDFDSNNDETFNQVDLRFLTTPFPSIDAFLRMGADWNRGSNNNPRPRFQLREAHMRFHRNFGSKGFEAYLFTRQRRYWVDNHLIKVVQDDQASGDGNGQAVRLDTWGFLGFHMAAIYSDFSGVCLDQSRSPSGATQCGPASAQTDDGYIFRLWRPTFGDRLRAGFTYNRKNEREASDRTQPLQFTEVVAFDTRLRLFDVDYRFEIARGRENILKSRTLSGDIPADALQWQLSKLSFSDPQAGIPDDVVMRAEIRAFRFGTPRLGYFNVAPSAWILGPQFRNQLGDGNNDEKGYSINGWYLVPGKAITLTTNYVVTQKEFFQQRTYKEFYQELFTEYVNGFTTKFAYTRRRTEDFFVDTGESRLSRNDDLFGELVVENQVAWLRVQGRIKDLNTALKKDLLAIEASVNISNTVKVYNRYTFANDPGRQRKGLFTELQYRPTANVELFLSYGAFWIGGGSNPVFEGNLEGSGDHRDLFRLILKGNF